MSQEMKRSNKWEFIFWFLLFVLLLYRGTKTPRTPSSIKGILKTDRGGPEVGFSINLLNSFSWRINFYESLSFFSLWSLVCFGTLMSEILFVFVLTEDSISDVQTVKQWVLFSFLCHCSCFVLLNLQRNSVAEWSARRTRNLEALGLSPPCTASYNPGHNLLKHFQKAQDNLSGFTNTCFASFNVAFMGLLGHKRLQNQHRRRRGSEIGNRFNNYNWECRIVSRSSRVQLFDHTCK